MYPGVKTNTPAWKKTRWREKKTRRRATKTRQREKKHAGVKKNTPAWNHNMWFNQSHPASSRAVKKIIIHFRPRQRVSSTFFVWWKNSFLDGKYILLMKKHIFWLFCSEHLFAMHARVACRWRWLELHGCTMKLLCLDQIQDYCRVARTKESCMLSFKKP